MTSFGPLVVFVRRFVRSLVLYLLWARTMRRLCQAVSYAFSVSYFTLMPTAFSFYFCDEILLQFRMLRIRIVCDLTFPAGLWLTDTFSLWRGCVNICCFYVHSVASEVVANFLSKSTRVRVMPVESD